MLKKVLIICTIGLCLLVGFLGGNALAEGISLTASVSAAPPLETNYVAAAASSVAIERAIALANDAKRAADTAFVLLCTALVLLMVPGLAFFYGGFVRKVNVLNTLMMSFILMALVGVTWILWGYSLTFAPNDLPVLGKVIGGLQWSFLNNESVSHLVQPNGYLPKMAYEASLPPDRVLTSYAATIPHQAFSIHQVMFAIITPALISGAMVERINFRAYFLFVLLWSTFIYCPIAHMVWAKGGFLGVKGGLGVLDFAGGTVVHTSSGVSALVAAIVLGPRRNFPNQLTAPHNVPFILLGAGLLWFGWFGFTAGSAMQANSTATVAFVATNTAAAAAALMWVILEWGFGGKPTAVGIATGAVTGLVAITPAAGFVTPLGALSIGAIAAVCCFFAIGIKVKLGIDDALDTYPVHGVGGTVGAILTGVFATKLVNPNGGNGLLLGDKGLLFQGNDPSQVVKQLAAVGITYIIAAAGTFIILKILDATVGLRIKRDSELQGMDINEHGEEGYAEEFAGGLSLRSE